MCDINLNFYLISLIMSIDMFGLSYLLVTWLELSSDNLLCGWHWNECEYAIKIKSFFYTNEASCFLNSILKWDNY